VTEGDDIFRRSYAFTLRRYLRHETEDLLHAAYELGREAVGRGLTVLDVAQAHHGALASAVRDAGQREDASLIIERAGALLLESLAAFEMVKRGFGEAQQAAADERRSARMLRHLSALLGDASLATGGDRSLAEMLRIVVEQARELTAADRSRVSLTGARAGRISVCAGDGSWDDDPQAGWAGVRAIAATEEDGEAGSERDRLEEPLTTLDGRRLGSLEIQAGHGRHFGEADRAVLRQVAEMASAAVERLEMHRPSQTPGGAPV
jgi:hypothetical protein